MNATGATGPRFSGSMFLVNNLSGPLARHYANEINRTAMPHSAERVEVAELVGRRVNGKPLGDTIYYSDSNGSIDRLIQLLRESGGLTPGRADSIRDSADSLAHAVEKYPGLALYADLPAAEALELIRQIKKLDKQA